jgi:flavin reductase (DIM6/NTAB) family NADH-FMN oxidoreductase RutF
MMNEIAALFHRLSHGMYVVSAAYDGRRNAFTAACVMQASYDPLLLAVSINPQNTSYALVRGSGSLIVNVLKRGQLDLARRFGTRSRRDEDKLVGVRWQPGRGGAPVLSEALAYFECELMQRVPAGDHELVLARVVGGRILDPGAEPMHYGDTGDMDGSSALFPDHF